MKMYHLILALVVAFLVSCNKQNQNIRTKSVDTQVAQQTERILAEANRQAGMPAIVNFQEKKLLKKLYESRDKEGLITYTYIVNMHGKKILLGKSIGYGIPYSAQYSNPERIVVNKWVGHGQGVGGLYGTLPQPEPNGLFMPTSSMATWVFLVDPKTNEPRPVYVESEILVSPFLLEAK